MLNKFKKYQAQNKWLKLLIMLKIDDVSLTNFKYSVEAIIVIMLGQSKSDNIVLMIISCSQKKLAFLTFEL